MQLEKMRITKVSRLFALIDLTVVIALYSCSAYYQYIMEVYIDDYDKFGTIQSYFTTTCAVINVVIGGALAWSALYLTKTIRQSTGRKPNVCLLFWHILNILLAILAEIV